MRILFLLLFVIPLVELYFLIQVGEEIGALPTVLLTIFTAIAGIALMRMQGLAIMQKAQISMASGQPPATEVMEGVFIFLGGIFLFFPGLITDGIGFLLLMPFVRHFLIKQSVSGMQSRGGFRQKTQQDEYYEGEWSESSTNARTTHRIKAEIIEGEVVEPVDSAKKP